jgi:predicted DsbA family dithiol-disulfide isomerase
LRREPETLPGRFSSDKREERGSMSLKIRVYSDYVCPYCFLAEKVLEEVARPKGAEIEWMPFELRPYPNPTLDPEGDDLQTVWAESVYPLAESLEVKILLPRISPQPRTALAFEGYQFAREHGRASEYSHRIFTALFQQGRDIGQADVLAELAGEVGLDREGFRQALATRKYGEAHQRALRHAIEEAHITAVPTLVFGRQTLRGLPAKLFLDWALDVELGRAGERRG